VLLHVVQEGEALYTIAERYQVGLEAIEGANNITEPYLIFPGQELVIPL
jgi:LysM repeat protein